MKKLYILLMITIIPFIVKSQLPIQKVHQTVEYDEIIKNWDLYETKEFEDIKIFRMDGENGIHHRTNLLYLSSFCEQDGIYGKLAIFNDRNSKELADPSLFTVEILDTESENPYLTYTLQGEPHHFKRDIWYNYLTMEIPERVSKRFLVRITDKGLNKSFLFFVFGLPEKCYLPDPEGELRSQSLEDRLRFKNDLIIKLK